MTAYQKHYWSDPDHCRSLQKAKYQRYPERIKEINKKWQEENAVYWNVLKSFNSKIWYERNHKNRTDKLEALVAMKERYKAATRRLKTLA